MEDFVNVDIEPEDIKPSLVALALTALIWHEASGLYHEPDYKLIRSYAIRLHHFISKSWHD